MIDSNIEDGSYINSIIGKGTKFKGEFDFDGLLKIEGDFSGVIRTTGKVVIGGEGRAECTMRTGTVMIGGILRGDIYSTKKVIILQTGMVLGNITTPCLEIAEGAIFNGICNISKAEDKILQAEDPVADAVSDQGNVVSEQSRLSGNFIPDENSYPKINSSEEKTESQRQETLSARN